MDDFGQSNCDCTEVLQYSKMFNIGIPCLHLISQGVSFLPFRNIVKSKFEHEGLTPLISISEGTNLPEEVDALAYLDHEQRMIKEIQKFSKSKNRKEICIFVKENRRTSDEFFQGFAVNTIRTISA